MKSVCFYYLKRLKKRTLVKYNNKVNQCSGANSGPTNDEIRKESYEFASFLAELDKEIKQGDLWKETIQSDYSLIKNVKNKIVDIIIPTDREIGTKSYHGKMMQASKLADSLENFFMLAYNLGRGRKNMSQEEIDQIDSKWMKKCTDDLQKAYSEGSKSLIMLLSMACSNKKIMDELKERKIL